MMMTTHVLFDPRWALTHRTVCTDPPPSPLHTQTNGQSKIFDPGITRGRSSPSCAFCPARSHPKRWHAGGVDRVDHLFSAAANLVGVGVPQAAATRLCTEVVESQVRLLGESHPEVLRTRSNLAELVRLPRPTAQPKR